MILTHLDTSKIQTTEWFMLELRSERTSEETIRRIGKELATVFPNDPAEVFIPIRERSLTTFTLLTDCYLFVRADDPVKVGKLRRVTGVLGILAKDDSVRPAKFIRVPDDYVQGLITTCFEQHLQRSKGIKDGSWVRLIDGQMRDFCGYVIQILEGRATVRVAARTKLIVVETSIHNLSDLSDVPVGARVFYYSEPVDRFLAEEGEEAAAALQPDRQFNAEEMAGFLRQHAVEATALHGPRDAAHPAMSREQTPTRFLESLLDGGERDVHVLLAKTVAAIRSHHLKAPSTATVLWHVIRETIRRRLFGGNPSIKVYSDVVQTYGPAWALTPKQVLAAIPELPLRLLHGAEASTDAGAPIRPPRPTVTITALVRAELDRGGRDMWPVVGAAMEALTRNTLRVPKHLDSVVQAIRTQVLREFRDQCPTEDIRALAEEYGPGLHITSQDVQARYPAMASLIQTRRREQVAPDSPTSKNDRSH